MVELTVERRNGTFGEVRVNWQLMGDHSETEIRPLSGEVHNHSNDFDLLLLFLGEIC